jgi:hypothetical protein
MKRMVTAAMMICLVGAGLASAETPSQPQTATSTPAQMEQQQNNCAAKTEISAKEAKKQAKMARKQAKEEQKRQRQQAEPQGNQDPVETGGGG